MKIFFLIQFFILFIVFSYGQHKNKVQVAGVAYNMINNEPVRFVNIIVNNKYGTSGDIIGRFSFIAEKKDTIVFSSVGYKKATLIISDTINEKFLEIKLLMLPDTIEIQPVNIFPWPTYEDFKIAFINLRLDDNEINNANKNIELVKKRIIHDQASDPLISYKNAMKQYNEQAFNRGILYPTNSLLNPFAWAKFIKAIRDGDFKKKE